MKLFETFAGFFVVICVIPMLALFVVGLATAEDDHKNRAIENYNKVYAALSDTQKRKADSLPPVCAEETFNEYRCVRRTELLERAYVFSDDSVIQSGGIVTEVTE